MARAPTLRLAGPTWSGFGLAAALLSVVLYVALLSSHIVSQATSHLSLADTQTALAGMQCHAPDSSTENGDRQPAPASKKCPLCTGYGALGLVIVAPPVGICVDQFVAKRPSYVYVTAAFNAGEWRSWQPRGPPAVQA